VRRVGADIVVLRRKERRVVGKEIRTDELLIKQEDVRKVWVTVKKYFEGMFKCWDFGS
jgi:hypothetical protein